MRKLFSKIWKGQLIHFIRKAGIGVTVFLLLGVIAGCGNDKIDITNQPPEPETIDLFDEIDITYTGIAPKVSAVLVTGNSDPDLKVSYELDKSENLNIGDLITVTANYDKESLFQSGYQAESDFKEFEVVDVAKYITDSSEIPEDIIEKMKKQTEDAFHAHVANDWEEQEIFTGMDFMGYYLLTLRSGRNRGAVSYGNAPGWTNVHNAVFMVYQVDVERSGETYSFYTYSHFNNLFLEDGICNVDISDYEMPYGSGTSGNVSGEAFEREGFIYIGYENIYSLFSNCITANTPEYEYFFNDAE